MTTTLLPAFSIAGPALSVADVSKTAAPGSVGPLAGDFATLLGATDPAETRPTSRRSTAPAEEAAPSYALSAPIAPGLLLPSSAPFVVALQLGRSAVEPPPQIAAIAQSAVADAALPPTELSLSAPEPAPAPSSQVAGAAQARAAPQSLFADAVGLSTSAPAPAPAASSAPAPPQTAAATSAITPPRSERAPNHAAKSANAREGMAAASHALAPAQDAEPRMDPQPAAATSSSSGKEQSQSPPADAPSRPLEPASAAALQTAMSAAIEAVAEPAPSGETVADVAAPQPAAGSALTSFEAPPLGATRPTPDTHALAHAVAHRFEGRSGGFEIRLDPEELGRVKISIEVADDSIASVTVAADRPETLSDLVRASRELERALQDAGLTLAENGLRFDLSQPRDEESDQGAAQKESSRGQDGETTETVEPVRARPFGLQAWSLSRIDLTI